MSLSLFYTIVGFALAGWSVIANDSIQTLGTYMANYIRFRWNNDQFCKRYYGF